MVMEVVHEDIGEDNMQCINHPYKNSTPGGICAFCLQEKLGKLVSSSYPSSVFPSSSSSSSTPSSRSTFNRSATTSAAPQPQNLSSSSRSNGYYTRKSRLMPFVSTHKGKKNNTTKDGAVVVNGSDSTGIVFKRSNSTATPRRRGNNNNINFLDENYSYRASRRGFWSFLYSSKHSPSKKNDGHSNDLSFNTPTHSTVSTAVGSSSSSVALTRDFVGVDGNCISPRVCRSRSVGCGSRRFSGDFFERISTGFGDCTLRRVESQREGGSNKPKVQPVQRNIGNGIKNVQEYCIKERVKCGGIFSGFMIASVEEGNNNVSHIKSKSWVWALASPMRAFGKPSNGKKDAHNNNSSSKNASPNLDAIPSLLAVSS